MNLANVKIGAVRLLHKTGLKLNQYSPEILLAMGIAAVVGGTILACTETLKVEEILDVHEEKRSQIDEAESWETDEYTSEDASRDRGLLVIKTGVKLAKNYAPAIALTLGGIACILTSYGILKRRNLALMAAYEAVSTAFDEYRKRVRDELGDEADKRFRFGAERLKDMSFTDEDGKAETAEIHKLKDGFMPSQYAKFFDETNENWSKSPERNLFFLRRIQNWANDKLFAQGYLFLNDVYRMLGIEPTTAGQIVGWVLGNGDNFIDFGLYNPDNEKARMFVNNAERSILLDFNVDGVVYKLLDRMAAKQG